FQQQQQPYGTPPGGFQQQGGYPQQAGYPVAPGYAPPMGSGPTEKPGAITGSAVLAFIQAGITLITTGLIFIGLFAAGSDAGAEGWLLAIAQLAGIILLIFGAVQ